MFKGYAERYILTNETHKITDAVELTKAVMSNGGPVNTKMCAAKIDKDSQKISKFKPLPNISTYHSVAYEGNGARYWEFFEIGPGKFHAFEGKCEREMFCYFCAVSLTFHGCIWPFLMHLLSN